MKVIIIGGFLGSGKTTLLLETAKKISEEKGQKVAIIVNEFGEVGIDDRLLKREGLPTYQLYNGCICCQMGDDLKNTLVHLTENYEPDIVLIEPSGISDPQKIKEICQKETEVVTFTRTVVLIDPFRLKQIEAVFESLFKSQIKSADTLYINKIDECEEKLLSSVRESLVSYNNSAPIFEISCRGHLNLEVFWKDVFND